MKISSKRIKPRCAQTEVLFKLLKSSLLTTELATLKQNKLKQAQTSSNRIRPNYCKNQLKVYERSKPMKISIREIKVYENQLNENQLKVYENQLNENQLKVYENQLKEKKGDKNQLKVYENQYKGDKNQLNENQLKEIKVYENQLKEIKVYENKLKSAQREEGR
jgi:hypothetical protein